MQAFRLDQASRAPAAPTPIHHGGDLATARARFPGVPEPWIDLSTGINPRSYPIPGLQADAWRRLPETAALRALESAAARAYGARQAEQVVAAPGTQALIQVLPRLLPAQRVAVLDFGYGEHPAVWRPAGALIRVTDSLHELEDADVAVVTNPNNPDGRCVAPDDLLSLGRKLAARGGTLVVDEAFADVAEPDLSLVPQAAERGILVLRSFGKFFGLAGLRLGFAISTPDLAARVRSMLGPWAVSGPALAIGARALADHAWCTGERARLKADAERLDRLLGAAGLKVIGGTALFRLVETNSAADWFERLAQAGILVRSFAERPPWLRFGLPGTEEAWTRLADVVRS